MKWSALAKVLLPVLGILVPGAAPLVPLIAAGITEADAIHSAADGATKKAHVLQLVADGAAAASASGKVAIDPATAQAVTGAVFAAIDGVHAVVNANAAKPATP